MPSIEEIVAARQLAANEAKLKRERLAKVEAERKRAEKARREEAEARETARLAKVRADARQKERDDAEAAERAAAERAEMEKAIARGERVRAGGNEKGRIAKQFAHMRSDAPSSSRSTSNRSAAPSSPNVGSTNIPIQLTREERRRIAEEREFGIIRDKSTSLFEKARSGTLTSASNVLGSIGPSRKPGASGTSGSALGRSQTSSNGIKILGTGQRRDTRSISDMVMGNGSLSRSGSEDHDDRRSGTSSDFFTLPGLRKKSNLVPGDDRAGAVSSSGGGRTPDGKNSARLNADAGPFRLRPSSSSSSSRLDRTASSSSSSTASKAPKPRPSAADSLKSRHGVVAGNARKRDLPSDSDDLDGDSDAEPGDRGRAGTVHKKVRTNGENRRTGSKEGKGGFHRGGSGGGILASLGFDPWGGRDSRKYYDRDIDSDDDDMEADAIQIQREEARAARQAREDDAREEAREKRRIEEKKRKKAQAGVMMDR